MMVATKVVPRATWTERPSAAIHSGLEKKRRYWVRPGSLGISSKTIEELKDMGITESTGTTRNSSTPPPSAASTRARGQPRQSPARPPPRHGNPVRGMRPPRRRT